MKSAGCNFLVTVALMALVYPTVLADTLELKDGRLLEGDYVGGTRTTLRFQIGDTVEVIPIQEALALTFSDAGPSAFGPGTAGVGENGSTAPSSARPLTVPAGTRFFVRTLDRIHSREDRAGARFTAVLKGNPKVYGRVVAPKGSTVYGRLTDARKGGRISGRAELQLELTDIVINGHRHPIVTDEYEVQGRSQGTAKKTFGGAALGALIGGSDGAKKGAAAGFGYSLLSKGKQVSIPAGTVIVFRLQQPLTLQA